MKVFITGATGFVGRSFARALSYHGADIHGLARPAADRSALDGLRITWHIGDVTAPETLREAIRGADWVIHAAGPLGKFGVAETVYQRAHVGGTRNVLAAAAAGSPGARILHVSSTGVAGPAPSDTDEDAPYTPTNMYERAKVDSEKAVLDVARRQDIVIARPALLYGPGDHHVLKLFQAIQRGRFFYIGSGNNYCHPTYIDDAIAGMLLCLQKGVTGGVYNITGPRAVTLRELGETIAAAVGVKAPWLHVPRWCASCGVSVLEQLCYLTRSTPPLSRSGVAFFSEHRRYLWGKARSDLGYAPRYNLGDGVCSTVQWYRKHGLLSS